MLLILVILLIIPNERIFANLTGFLNVLLKHVNGPPEITISDNRYKVK